MKLSEEQEKIVNATESRIAVIGPPGTGKTRVLTERIKRLLNNGVNSSDIVAITFTNFAANEMKTRIPNSGNMFIGTMHSYAAKVLSENGIFIDINKMVETGDFSELIHKVVDNNLKIPNIEYLFVDEVQDLCSHEFDFIKKLSAKNLFLGGDADQCIYQFKGAKPQLFNAYCLDNTTKTYILTHNFRCGQNIIDFAEYFLKYLPGKVIEVNVIGNLIDRGWVSRVDFSEALFELYRSKNYGNWFVLTRTNAELEEAGRQLQSFNIPFTSFKQGDFSNEEIAKFLNNNEVKLLTIHSAKGLEMDNVIVVGARNWNGEEKCIEYVAATRARKKLFWCPDIAVQRKKKNYIKPKEKKVGISWE